MKYLNPDISTMIGQMIMVGLRGFTKNDAEVFFNSIKDYSIGGVILYDQNITNSPPTSHNIRSPKQLKSFTGKLQSLSKIPILIAVDQEGGKVNRLKNEYGFPNSNSWEMIGKINDETKTEEHSLLIAKTLYNNGINLNFSPVLDLSSNSDSFIAKKERSFGSDPQSVAKHAEIFIKSHLKHSIIPVAKHFPGQGSAKKDTHNSFVDASGSWSKNELIPYTHLIKSECLPAAMSSHLFISKLDNKFPATLSKTIMVDLFRKKMKFEGVIFSDDPQMKALSEQYKLGRVLELMIKSGIDIFCFGNNLVYDSKIVHKIHKKIIELIRKGKVGENDIKISYERIMHLKSIINLI